MEGSFYAKRFLTCTIVTGKIAETATSEPYYAEGSKCSDCGMMLF